MGRGAHMFLRDCLVKHLIVGVHEASPVLWMIHRKLTSISNLNAAGAGVACRPRRSHPALIASPSASRHTSQTSTNCTTCTLFALLWCINSQSKRLMPEEGSMPLASSC